MLARGRGRIARDSSVLADAAVILSERGELTPRRLEIQLEIPLAAAAASTSPVP